MNVLGLWRKCEIKPSELKEVEMIADHVWVNRSRYQAVQAKLGVPWYVIAAIHSREASLNFSTYLGNGQPLKQKTTLVPKGRGPFATWEAGAEDAIELTNLHNLPKGWKWDLVTSLIQCEIYNGTGYERLDLPSPYVWACTTVQEPGKYTGDGQFNGYYVDTQPGCAAIFLALKQFYHVDLGEDLPADKPAPEVTVAAKPPVEAPSPMATEEQNLAFWARVEKAMALILNRKA